jgi:putative redox protein
MSQVKASINKQHYKTEIVTAGNTLISDEPTENGGNNEGFSPSELLAASLAACTTITLRMYADRKGWLIEKIDVEVKVERDEEQNITGIDRIIHFSSTLDTETKKRMLAIAEKCPIHKILSNKIIITTSEQ